jgi:hypothetical protein
MLLLGGCDAPLRKAQQLAPGLMLDSGTRTLHVLGVMSIDEGWLEQIACLEGTRDHEVLVTTRVLPSQVHAGLLLLGARPGAPGSWRWIQDALELTPPSGQDIDVFVQVGQMNPVPVSQWIVSQDQGAFPDLPWCFAGSGFVSSGASEQYEADLSGSLIGLVTFGDELLAWRQVLPHQDAVQAPQWQVGGDVPQPGTPVTLILRLHEAR